MNPSDPSSNAPSSPAPDSADDEPFLQRLREAAYEAERETGRREATPEEVERSLVRRMLRAIAGFFVIAIGIAALPLPGPGWVIIIVGLSLLPFAWAERTIRLIRRKIPGVPEDGRIPTHMWVIMGALVVGATMISILWGSDIAGWASDTWQNWTS